MKGSDLIRIVDQMQHEKNIDREIIFSGIEAALQLATEKRYGEGSGITVSIDRDTGAIHIQALKDGVPVDHEIDPSELGRIAAQSAKQVMIQKIREAECKSVFEEFAGMKGDLIQGSLTRHEGGASIVSVGKTEAILPRSEQIPGETHHVNERIKSVILEVKKVGQRVKIILSRTHPEFVRRLFENEIPEIGKDRTIEIKAIAREAGYRAKVAVSSIDLKVDCVGACVGVRGSRIKNIVDELGGERIDIVRWNDSLQVMIPNALQPAQIDEVFLYPRLGRAIVLVKEDQLSLAIGRRGQNVRLASKLVGWDIEIMTLDELNDGIERAERWFRLLPHVSDEIVEALITEGFLSYEDLTFLDPAEMSEFTGLTEDQAMDLIDFAENEAARIEREGDTGAPQAQAAEEGELAEGELAEGAVTEGESVEGQEAFAETPAVGMEGEMRETEGEETLSAAGDDGAAMEESYAGEQAEGTADGQVVEEAEASTPYADAEVGGPAHEEERGS